MTKHFMNTTIHNGKIVLQFWLSIFFGFLLWVNLFYRLTKLSCSCYVWKWISLAAARSILVRSPPGRQPEWESCKSAYKKKTSSLPHKWLMVCMHLKFVRETPVHFASLLIMRWPAFPAENYELPTLSCGLTLWTLGWWCDRPLRDTWKSENFLRCRIIVPCSV